MGEASGGTGRKGRAGSFAWTSRLLCPAPNDLSLLALLVSVVVSLVVSPAPGTSLRAAWPLAAGLLLAALVARWPTTIAELQTIWLVLGLATAGLALLGLWGMQAKTRVLWPQLQKGLAALLALRDRVVGRPPDAFHPNVVAGALVVLLPFSLALALRPRSAARPRGERAARLLGLLAWLLGGAVVLLTQSRGAYLGLAAGLLVQVCLWPRALYVLVPCVVCLAVAGIAVAGWQSLAGLATLGGAGYGLGWRSAVWANGLRILASFPWTGVGLGCFRLVTGTLYPMLGVGSIDASHAHSLFLQVGIDLGIPGLVAYLANLMISFFLLAKSYRVCARGGNGANRLLSAACTSALAGMCVHGLVDVAVWGNKGAFLPWVVMGLSAALQRVGEQAHG